MAKEDGYVVTRYRPTSKSEAYRAIGNSEGMKAMLLEKARRIANAATTAGDLITTEDVRDGKVVAHARVKCKKYRNAQNYRERGHNLKIDRILQQSIDAARG